MLSKAFKAPVEAGERLGPCLGLSRASVLPTGPLCANALNSVDEPSGMFWSSRRESFSKSPPG
jgi:hypothetical protein